MKNRRIIDYIVLDAPYIELPNFLDRINVRTKGIINRIDSYKESIEKLTAKIERYEFLYKEYNRFKEGQEYKVPTDKEEREWEKIANKNKLLSESFYKHPLHEYKKFSGIAVFFDSNNASDQFRFSPFENARREITDIYNNLKMSYDHHLKELNQLKKELKYLETNNNPITNKSIRTSFETQVFDLIAKGYEPLGGIEVKYNRYHQAMVKYEE